MKARETRSPDPFAPIRLTAVAAPAAAATRWAQHVLAGCQSEGDLKTLQSWARFIGVSYSSLREGCRLVNVRPRDARDFMRALRAIIRASAYCCPPEVLLDLSDIRTLRAFLRKSGDGFRAAVDGGGIERFLQTQTFVDGNNFGLATLRLMCGSWIEDGESVAS